MTIGPYFVDEQRNRLDIRSEPSDNSVKEGVPLTIVIGVFDVANSSCTPLEPYASKGHRVTRNSNDNIFMSGGDLLLLNLQGDNTNGYTAAIKIGLDLTDTEVGAADSMGQGGLGGTPA